MDDYITEVNIGIQIQLMTLQLIEKLIQQRAHTHYHKTEIVLIN